MERDRRRGLMFWTPAPLRSPSFDFSEAASEEEEQGHVYSGVDHSGLELALDQAVDQIGLGEDDMGVGAYCEDAGVNTNGDNCHTLPTEGDNGDRLDLGVHLIIDLDISPEENNHSVTRCLNDLTPEDHLTPEELSPSHHCPQPPSRAPSLPLLIRPEEASATSAIMDEIPPEIHFWDSSTDSQNSPMPSPPPKKLIDFNSSNLSAETRALNEHRGQSKIPVKMTKKASPEGTHLSATSSSKAGSGPLKSSCQTRPFSRTQDAPQVSLFRIPNGLMPDISKVEPRVRFPKDGYTPPKSRCALRRASLSPEPPLVFKSPADIVKEVLLAQDPEEESSLILNALSIVPQEFRSRQQATALMDELQEDNYRLKIKCAEKENTIDRLRLEGKVNLFSDPPKPGLPLHSGLRTQASHPLTVEIPRTHRAQFSSSLQTGTSTSTSGESCSDMFDKLCKGAQMFLHNVLAFERTIRSGTTQPEKQSEVVRVLSQKLDHLEKGYLLAKKEQTQQGQSEDTGCSFDPEWELESLIFECGQRMDELKERVQPTNLMPPTHQAAHFPSLQTPPFPGDSAGSCPISTSEGKQAQRFLQNAEVQNGKLETEQQRKIVYEIIQKMNALEKDYILAIEEHTRQKMDSFDPRWNVESLVLQCSQQMDKLRDRVQSNQATSPTIRPQAAPIQQAPLTCRNTDPQAPLSCLNTDPQALLSCLNTSPLSCLPLQTQQAMPTLPLQTVPLPTSSAVGRIQSSSSSTLLSLSPSTLRSSASEEDHHQTPMTPELLKKDGADQPDSTRLNQNLKVLPKPLVRDLSEDSCRGPVFTADPEFENDNERLSMANAQTEHQQGRIAVCTPGPSALPTHPAVTSRHPKSLPLCPPSLSTSEASHPFTRGALNLAQTHAHGPSRGRSEVGQSPSSSLSSLREAPERTDNKAPSERQRGLSQDGVISPETDSGFLGSEGSHLTPAAASSAFHQREPPDVCREPLVDPCPAPALSRHGPSVRSRRGEGRRTSFASHSQPHRAYTALRPAHHVASLSRHNWLHGSSTSEEDQSEHSSSSALSFRHREDLRKAPHTGRGARHNEALELLQAEVLKLKYNMDTLVRSRDQAEKRQPSASTPVSRSDRHKAGHSGQQEEVEPEEDALVWKSQTEQKKSVSSKTSQTGHCFPAQVTRPTQTSVDHCAHSDTVRTRRQLRPSVEKTEAEDRQFKVPVCPECLLRGKSRDGSFKGNPSKHANDCPHCQPCGALETDCFSSRGPRTFFSDRPIHCVPVCPHPLLLYSPPLVHLCPTKSEGPPRLRGLIEGRPQCSVPADGLASLDTSLNRALRAGWSMKRTSRHMVQTLATGLQYRHTR